MSTKNHLVRRTLQKYARHFPLQKGKRRLVRKVSNLLSINQGIRTSPLIFNGLKMKCDLSKLMQNELFFFGSYEEEDCRWWMQMVRDSTVIFDVGANVGLYSLLAASSNGKATVHAFEPTPILASAVAENARLNGLKNIVINQMAVSETNGEVFLNFCAGRDGSITNEGMNFVTSEKLQAEGEAVESVALDSYCQKHGINSIDLMKMDIEGGESSALLGAQELLKRGAIKCILLELVESHDNREGSSTKNVRRILMENEYEIYTLRAGEKVLVDIESGCASGGNVIAMPIRKK